MTPRILRAATLLLLLGILAHWPQQAHAQCDEAAELCSGLLIPFNSTGQYYRAQLYPGESARLRLTFYRGMSYRIVPCGSDGNKLQFTLTDKRGKELFNTETAPQQSYYDFSFGATSDYTLVARFKDGGGCAAIVIGYRTEVEVVDED